MYDANIMKKSSSFYLKFNPDNRWSFRTEKWWSICSEISGQFTPKLGGQFDRLFQLGYEPKHKIKDIDCPIYFAICENDSVAPANVTSKYAKDAKKSIIKHYPYGHFGIYLGEAFNNVIIDHIEFYKENLIA